VQHFLWPCILGADNALDRSSTTLVCRRPYRQTSHHLLKADLKKQLAKVRVLHVCLDRRLSITQVINTIVPMVDNLRQIQEQDHQLDNESWIACIEEEEEVTSKETAKYLRSLNPPQAPLVQPRAIKTCDKWKSWRKGCGDVY
jgi:hypothetical protein